MNEWVITALQDKDPITWQIERDLLEKGFITGSSVFGGFIKGRSDIDIVIPPKAGIHAHDLDYYFVYEGGNYSEEDDAFRSFYMRNEKFEIYNVLLMWDADICRVWRKATRLMIHMVQNKQMAKLCKSKYYRVKQFELLKEMIQYPDWRDKQDNKPDEDDISF